MVLTKPNGNRSEECMARQKDAQTTGRTARLVVLAENDVDWNAAQLLADHLQVEAVCGRQKERIWFSGWMKMDLRWSEESWFCVATLPGCCHACGSAISSGSFWCVLQR